MADGITTYGDINQRTAIWAMAEYLRHAEPVLVLNKFGQSQPLPKNKADTAKFRRPKIYGALTTPLAEGITPTTQKFGYDDVSVQMKQYGGLFGITDVVQDLQEDPVLMHMSKAAGEQAAYTIEAVTYGVVKAGTNVFFSNGVIRTSVNTPVNLSKIRAVIRALQAQKADPITEILSASPNYGTKAIEASYVAVHHTDLTPDIRGIPGFVPTAQYGQRSLVHPREVGSVEDVRFVSTPDLPPWTDAGGAYLGSGSAMVTTTGVSADVYPILIFGKDAYGVVPLKGMGAVTPTVVNPKPSSSDPLGQRGYVGWKTYFAAVILNDLWMARLEVATSQL